MWNNVGIDVPSFFGGSKSTTSRDVSPVRWFERSRPGWTICLKMMGNSLYNPPFLVEFHHDSLAWNLGTFRGFFSMRKKNHRWLLHRMEVKKVHQSWVFNHSKRTLCETLWNKHGAHDWIGGWWATDGNVCLTKRSERFGSNQDKCRKHVNLGTTMGLKMST